MPLPSSRQYLLDSGIPRFHEKRQPRLQLPFDYGIRLYFEASCLSKGEIIKKLFAYQRNIRDKHRHSADVCAVISVVRGHSV